MKKGDNVIAAVFLSGILLAGSGFSLISQDVPQPKLQYDVRVVLKLVQVSVLDKDGNPVTDLTKADFDVTDNGKAVVIDQFERRVAGAPESPDGTMGTGYNRRYFLVFDFSLTRPGGILKARKIARRFLDEVVRPSDEVALVSYSSLMGLRVHEYLTMDHARIRKGIEALAPGSLIGRAENLASYWVMQSARSQGSGKGGDSSLDYEYAAQYGDTSVYNKDKKTDAVNQAIQFTIYFRMLAKSLRYVPGTKNVILLSEGIPQPLLYGARKTDIQSMSALGESDLGTRLNPSFSAAQIPRTNLLNIYEGMMNEFKASNCPVYTIDVGQARSGPDIEVAEGSETGGTQDFLGTGSLREISDTTGGRYLGKVANEAKALQSIQAVTGAVYVLGFPVEDSWDGKYHKLKVKVRRKGCDVSAQAGFYNSKPYSEYSTDDKLFQLMDLALSDNPEFLATGGELPFVAFPVWDQGWSYAAGMARIEDERTAGALGKDVESYLLILKENNDLQSIASLKFGNPPPSKGALDARFVMPMKPGRYNLRLVVRNRVTGWGARGSSVLVVPDAASSVFWVDPPLLLAAESGVVQAESDPSMKLAVLYPYDAEAYAPVLRPVPAGTEKLFAVLRCAGGTPGAELEVSASDSRPGGQAETPVSVVVNGSTVQGNTRILFVEFPGAGFAAGTHKLAFEIREKSGLMSGATALLFRVQ
jgi:VWFA-related protein